MTRRTKRIVQLVVALGLLALVLPISNLVLGTPSGTVLTTPPHSDAQRIAAAGVLEESCAACHVAGVPRPFYSKVPVVAGLLERDVRLGLQNFDLGAEVEVRDRPVAEPALAKIEHEIVEADMPPLPYLAMHWNARLSAREKGVLLEWIRSSRAQQAAAGLPPLAASLSIRPLPRSLGYDVRKAALGEKLYHDKRLSGDDTLSCASCHDLAKGGTDQRVVSDGIRGQKGGINAPTTFNSALAFVQFWDGRAATLEAQAGGPPLNPVEMGSSDWTTIVDRLDKDAAFRKEFVAVYPEGLNEKTITGAIAEFERTLVTPNSRFDKYLLGDESALSEAEKRGHATFQRVGCVTCHVGELLGGKSYERMGRVHDYFADRKQPTTAADDGRYNVTKLEQDRHRFKVPTLRNVALTFPYFHDGSRQTLREAVEVMAHDQIDHTLTETEITEIVAFLETLTGEYRGRKL